MPDIRTYYYATHLSRLIDWCRHCGTKLWPQLEQAQSVVPLPRAPWCYVSLPTNVKWHSFIGPTTRIYTYLLTRDSFSSRKLPLVPILGNPLFTPGLCNATFQNLIRSGYFQASHFWTTGRWLSILELTDPEGPFRLDFLRALQLRHFLKSVPPPSKSGQPLTTLEECCWDTGVLPHTLSLTYNLLIATPEDFQPPGLIGWELDLNLHFNPCQQLHILRFIHKSSICAKTQDTNFKVLLRWYRTLSQLHKFFPITSDLC